MWPDTIKPDSNFVSGRVGCRAELAAEARPYVLFFGSSRHDDPTGPSGYRARPARSNLCYAFKGQWLTARVPDGVEQWLGEREGEITTGRRRNSSTSPWPMA
jgi:hypothetical protein